MERAEYIPDEQVVKRANAAVKIELEKMRALGVPIVGFDRKTKTVYQKSTDGTETTLAIKGREGRYSERVGKKA
ncbi:MAG: hypothetical protein J1F02_00095 [Lachnospiraceae bacterium]|nr:hypothetical protein [Lachnospiraceae bacterium]